MAVLEFFSRVPLEPDEDLLRVLGTIGWIVGNIAVSFLPDGDQSASQFYLAGGAAHPGPGMPMVLMSGWIAADSLDRDGIAAAPVRARRSA